MDEYTLLHSGCTLLGDGEPLLRNEGVDIVLDQCATAAWKNAGEACEAVNSRIVTAQLKIVQHGHWQHGGSRLTSNKYLSLISTYAPTAKAPPDVKTKFVDNLQGTLDSLPTGDIVMVLGDFNAQIGKQETEDDVWREVRGLHGIGTCNKAGEQLLELCT